MVATCYGSFICIPRPTAAQQQVVLLCRGGPRHTGTANQCHFSTGIRHHQTTCSLFTVLISKWPFNWVPNTTNVIAVVILPNEGRQRSIRKVHEAFGGNVSRLRFGFSAMTAALTLTEGCKPSLTTRRHGTVSTGLPTFRLDCFEVQSQIDLH